MYEVFPLVAGVVIALLVPRYVGAGQRKLAYGGLGVGVAALATIIAGEEWFFIFVDLAEVFIAMGVTLTIAAYYWPAWRATEPNPAVLADANAVRDTVSRVAKSFPGRNSD
ncbi:MAG TPA: hypothetical protein VH482_05330 [Thermomicrobiales bacterium]|jgi:hypothetical protein